jgi:hypothetical protein
MSKAAISRLFIGSIVAFIAGILLAGFAVIAAFANGGFVLEGPDVVGFNGTPFMWWMVAVVIVGGFAVIGGAIAGLVAWIGALINTAQLVDKTWFILLLVLGLLSFGFFAMVAYVLAGPDGTRQHVPTTGQTVNAGGMPA